MILADFFLCGSGSTSLLFRLFVVPEVYIGDEMNMNNEITGEVPVPQINFLSYFAVYIFRNVSMT